MLKETPEIEETPEYNFDGLRDGRQRLELTVLEKGLCLFGTILRVMNSLGPAMRRHDLRPGPWMRTRAVSTPRIPRPPNCAWACMQRVKIICRDIGRGLALSKG